MHSIVEIVLDAYRDFRQTVHCYVIAIGDPKKQPNVCFFQCKDEICSDQTSIKRRISCELIIIYASSGTSLDTSVAIMVSDGLFAAVAVRARNSRYRLNRCRYEDVNRFRTK